MSRFLQYLFQFIVLIHSVSALQIATSLLWIEHTPQPYAIRNFYKGSSPANLSSGGVGDLASDPQTYDLAANAETQGLKQYANHRNLRLISIICEVSYRIVADKRKGINTLSDLKGKRIGTIGKTSAAVFIHNMLTSIGVKDSEYTTVSGNVCMKAPCANDTMPSQLAAGTLDAFGVWEPSVELGADAIGSSNAVLFQNASIYREVYALYSTTDALNDRAKRKDIVEFVRALNKTLDIFGKQNGNETAVYEFVANEVMMDASVVKDVWADHKWGVRWGDDLIDFLVEEDQYLAKEDNRTVIPLKDLQTFLDTSIIDAI